MLLDGRQDVMELDMGAAVSVMYQCSYQEYIGSKPIESTTKCLSVYGGALLTVLDKSMVYVRQVDSEAELPLIIVKGGGLSLLGQDWLERLCLVWKAVHKLFKCTLDHVLQKH